MAIIISIVVAYVGVTGFKQEATSQKEMAVVIVANKTIAPYTILDKENLKKIQVPKDRIDPHAINNAEELFGKITTARIFSNEQVRKEKISSDLNIKDKEIVAINVDMVRSGAGWIQSGDIVDVWDLGGSAKTSGTNNALIVPNAIVLDLRNSAGKSVYANTNEVMASITSSITPSSSPTIAILVVDSSQTHNIVSAAKNQNAVLVKKFANTTKSYIPTNITNAEQNNITGTEKVEQKLHNIQDMFNM